MSERWRCFVAVPIGERLRADLAAAVEAWRVRPDLAGLRWTDAVAWHITLAFLGWVDPASVDEISARLTSVAADHGPMQLRTGGLGGFPSRAHARVAWYGVADPDGELHRVASDLRTALGIDAGDRFRAHVTLARARSEPVDLLGLVADESAPEGELAVNRLELMRSHLGKGPARYERLARARLGVPARV